MPVGPAVQRADIPPPQSVEKMKQLLCPPSNVEDFALHLLGYNLTDLRISSYAFRPSVCLCVQVSVKMQCRFRDYRDMP